MLHPPEKFGSLCSNVYIRLYVLTPSHTRAHHRTSYSTTTLDSRPQSGVLKTDHRGRVPRGKGRTEFEEEGKPRVDRSQVNRCL